jgi:uncharacterized membrane protein
MDFFRDNPLLFTLLLIWAVVTVILVVLFIYRGTLETHEDDQVFLDAAEERMAEDQRVLVTKIDKVTKPIHFFMALSGALLAVIAAIWIWQIYKTF